MEFENNSSFEHWWRRPYCQAQVQVQVGCRSREGQDSQVRVRSVSGQLKDFNFKSKILTWAMDYKMDIKRVHLGDREYLLQVV